MSFRVPGPNSFVSMYNTLHLRLSVTYRMYIHLGDLLRPDGSQDALYNSSWLRSFNNAFKSTLVDVLVLRTPSLVEPSLNRKGGGRTFTLAPATALCGRLPSIDFR
jgi:hypothetical protein